MVKQFKVDEPWMPHKCTLGESPIYEPSTGKLRFIDPEGKEILWLDPKKGPESLERIKPTDKIGFTADIEGLDDSTLMVGAKYGFAYYSKGPNTLKYIHPPSAYWTAESEASDSDKPRRMRFNDGAVDRRGRLWCSMINDPEFKEFSPEGALFWMDPTAPAHTLHRALSDLTIGNGMGWSADGRTMYHTDSPTRQIRAWDFDEETAAMSNMRVFYDVGWEEPDDGAFRVPDGFAQDEEGGFWVALFGAGKVVRVVENRQTGRAEKVAEIILPTPNITCPGFVGTELWITTAKDDKGSQYAGALFKVDVGVRGIPENKWPTKPA